MNTISEHAPDPQAFWDLVKDRFVLPTKTANKVSAFWFTTLFWDKHKLKPYWGEWEERIGAIGSELAGDYLWLDKREKFHEKVLGDISRWWRLLDINTVVKEQANDFTGKSNRAFDNTQGQSGKRVISKNSPYESVDLPQNFYGIQDRANFLAVEMGIQSGIRVRDPDDPEGKKWITKPDSSNTASSSAGIDKGHSHLTRNIRSKQQPNQRVPQLLKLFKMVEYNVNELWGNYKHHFKEFSYPQGKFEIDPYTGFFNWKTRYEIEAELPDAVKKKRADIEEGYKPLPKKDWERKFEAGERVEEKWELENGRLYREFLERQAKKSSGKNLEMLERNIGYCKAIREGWERPLTWPTIEQYDAEMNSIEGFEEFKSQLRMNFVNNRRAAEQGQMTTQNYYNLTGFPGTGKTLIAMTYAEAVERPFVNVGFASQNHPKVIEGISQSYQGAEISRTLAAFVEERADINYTIEDLEKELKYLEELPNVKAGMPTERQQWRMDGDGKGENLASTCLKTRIKEMKEKGITQAKESRYSRAPILLLDEYEKCGDKPTKQAVGNISETKSCENFFDKFFGFTVDIREMTLFITCNYEYAIEPFIKSRFDAILIDVPTYGLRMRTIWGIVKKLTRERFPAFDNEANEDGSPNAGMKGREIDKKNKKENKLTKKQKQIFDMFDDDFIKWTIDEGWGVREVVEIWAKKIMPTLYYFDAVYVNNDKNQKTLLDLLLEKKDKLSKMAIDKLGRFKETGMGIITLKFFNDSITTGEQPIMTWNYKRLTEPNRHPETGVATGIIDSAIRVKGIVKKRDGGYDNWFEANNTSDTNDWEKIKNAVPSWWKLIEGEEWRMPTFRKE